MRNQDTSISVVICGEAGQGVQTIESLLTRIIKVNNFHVYATKEYMSRIRGGSNSTQIRVDSGPVRAPVQRIDVAVLLDAGALPHLRWRFSAHTVIIGERQALGTFSESIIDVPFSTIAQELGNPLYANSVAVGVLCGLLAIVEERAAREIEKFFTGKPAEVIVANQDALRRGYSCSADIRRRRGCFPWQIPQSDAKIAEEIVLNGAESVGMGALAGGCNFVSSYPMSPSTGVLTFLATQARRFNVIAEQAEDEISAINMAIGAWYAGARALVTTSGGGFALMEEGVSLAGMLESPLVIHLAQRPGPATGLPTRTEQGDLDLALYSGHGEFPRVIFAPGSVCEAFWCAQQAFAVADKYQIPVFILTDQYLMDSYYNHPVFDVSSLEVSPRSVATDKNYQRYRLTPDGISPRGIPGNGNGLVRVDSDEHDERAQITEDRLVRTQMVEKRLKKMTALQAEAVPPRVTGSTTYRIALVCWGSTRLIVEEACARLERDDLAVLHFRQVYPLHADTAAYLRRAEQLIVIENNATGQFARLLQMTTGVPVSEKILKYDGLPFFVDELTERLRIVLTGGDHGDRE
ncbi:MAG: 2-oxoacid:acceptor oxidoreductase subunit alpha [Candidatus Omnitrophica bacterium]|nr:2-oxoacid:acceptor oxidoreductase subunit alpha [Candidatus Omnitrophota bacterium]